MRRRDVIAMAGGAAAFSVSQPTFGQRDLPLVGVLVGNPSDQARPRIDAVRKGLQEAGLIEGVDYAFALRIADGIFDRLPGLARELAALKPRVIVAAAAAVPVFHQVAPDLPMVFTGYADDAIKNGLAESYTHPGGATTGNVINAGGGDGSLTRKRIGMLRELVPNLKRLGLIGTAFGNMAMTELNALRGVADESGFNIVHFAVQSIDRIDGIEGVLASREMDDMDALYVSASPLLYAHMARVLPLLMAKRKPTVGTYAEWARAGVLIAYSADLIDGFRRAGIYVAKILRGEKPGDLPIEQASKFTLVVNAKTAKELGIPVPVTLLAQADEVID